MEEGVRLAEGLTPLAIETDDTGAARSLRVSAQRLGADGKWTEERRAELPANPSDRGGHAAQYGAGAGEAATFKLDGRYFQACDETGARVTPEMISSPRPCARAVDGGQ